VAARRGGIVFFAVVLMSLVPAGSGLAAQTYAPLDAPGPALSVPAAKLGAALRCTSGISHASRNPVLLVPGTNLDPEPNFSWNYERAFAAMGWPYCTVTLPGHALGDIQVAGEYVVYALRTMARTAGRRIDVLGYSQGGMLPRWALRFWPDTRRLVEDLVGLDPSNHGTVVADASCRSPCPAADWQQASAARFISALNSRTETFAGIDYTVVFSRTDEVVVPNFDASGSSSLHTGAGRIANVAVQEICPSDSSDHLAMGSYDPVGYALAVDALTHPGTADKARIPATVCAQPFQPGVNAASFASDYAGFLAAIGNAQQEAPALSAEPPLKCYVFAACPATTGQQQRCLARRAPIGPRNIGRVRLGYTRAQLLSRVPAPRKRGARTWRWCVKRGHGSVIAAFTRAGRVALVATTAPGHGNRRVLPGTRAAGFRRAYPGRRRIGRNLFRASPTSTRLIGLRGGRVRFEAVTWRRTIGRRRALRAYLHQAGVG
jgi:hypothetical protein